MSETKLLPCPNPWCESKAGYVDERGIWFSVVCEYCGNRGPGRKSREAAIAAWNTRPVTPDLIERVLKYVGEEQLRNLPRARVL